MNSSSDNPKRDTEGLAPTNTNRGLVILEHLTALSAMNGQMPASLKVIPSTPPSWHVTYAKVSSTTLFPPAFLPWCVGPPVTFRVAGAAR